MLRFIRIQNLAVIESTEVEFSPGFNVLTGETGAGKSIVADAVDLLLGGRASSDLVRTGQAAGHHRGVFEAAGRELVIRREITAQGRSRAFVDGLLVTASQLARPPEGWWTCTGSTSSSGCWIPTPSRDARSVRGPAGRPGPRGGTVGDLRRLREAFSRASMDARERSRAAGMAGLSNR